MSVMSFAQKGKEWTLWVSLRKSNEFFGISSKVREKKIIFNTPYAWSKCVNKSEKRKRLTWAFWYLLAIYMALWFKNCGNMSLKDACKRYLDLAEMVKEHRESLFYTQSARRLGHKEFLESIEFCRLILRELNKFDDWLLWLVIRDDLIVVIRHLMSYSLRRLIFS